MSEKVFRFISGLVLWGILIISTIYQNNQLMIAFCALFLFEGITNWRIPGLVTKVISKIRFGSFQAEEQIISNEAKNSALENIEAERMMRFFVVFFLFISFFTFPDILWFFPWYMAGMMIVAGISNICPMVMFLRWAGFK
jgi:hypothetical protein